MLSIDVDRFDSLSPLAQNSPSKTQSEDSYQSPKSQNGHVASVTPGVDRNKNSDVDMMTELEKCYLEFGFDIENVQFNHLGQYYIKLVVNSSFVKNAGKQEEVYSKIRVRKGGGEGGGYLERGNEAVTDMVEQEDVKQFYTFQENQFTFYLPKGECFSYFLFNEASVSRYVLKIKALTALQGSSYHFTIYPPSVIDYIAYIDIEFTLK